MPTQETATAALCGEGGRRPWRPSGDETSANRVAFVRLTDEDAPSVRDDHCSIERQRVD
jgi:hypothetical protein